MRTHIFIILLVGCFGCTQDTPPAQNVPDSLPESLFNVLSEADRAVLRTAHPLSPDAEVRIEYTGTNLASLVEACSQSTRIDENGIRIGRSYSRDRCDFLSGTNLLLTIHVRAPAFSISSGTYSGTYRKGGLVLRTMISQPLSAKRAHIVATQEYYLMFKGRITMPDGSAKLILSTGSLTRERNHHARIGDTVDALTLAKYEEIRYPTVPSGNTVDVSVLTVSTDVITIPLVRGQRKQLFVATPRGTSEPLILAEDATVSIGNDEYTIREIDTRAHEAVLLSKESRQEMRIEDVRRLPNNAFD